MGKGSTSHKEKGFRRNYRAISSTMATVIIAAVTITLVISSSFWTGGLANVFTRFEKVEVKNAYVTSSGGNYVVNIEYVNTGSSPTSIDSVLLNGVPYSSYMPHVILDKDFDTLPSKCETGESKSGKIIIPLGAVDPSGNKLCDGVTLTITLHTTGGKDYPTQVTLLGVGGLSSTVENDPQVALDLTESLNEKTSPSNISITSLHLLEDGKCYLGAFLEDSITPDQIRVKIPWWIQQTGKGLAWYAIMENFGSTESPNPLWMIDSYKPLIQDRLFDGLVLTWQPARNYDLQGTGEGCIADIVAGKYDSYIRTEAQRCKAAGYPIIIRFGHEMNGYWMGWGNSPQQFKEAWIRVVTLFREEEASNVAWFWCANYNDNPVDRKFQNYYPGDEYVDYVGIDVYANDNWNWWADPERQIGNPFGNVYDTYPNKPYIVGEWGCSPDLTQQQNALYVRKFFDAIEMRTRIKLIIHWHDNPWKLSSYPQALEVYRNRISNSRYLTEM